MGRLLYRYWNFGALEYKAAEEYLNRMVQKGYCFHSSTQKGDLISFRPLAQGQKVRYTVELYDTRYEKKWQDYQTLCKDAGWRHVFGCRSMQVFETSGAEELTPLQTDPLCAWNEIKQAVSMPYLLFLYGLAAIGLFLLSVYCFYHHREFPETGKMWTYICWACLSLMEGCCFLLLLVQTAFFFLRAKMMLMGDDPGPLPYISFPMAIIRKNCELFLATFFILGGYVSCAVNYILIIAASNAMSAKINLLLFLVSVPLYGIAERKQLNVADCQRKRWYTLQFVGLFLYCLGINMQNSY